MVAKVHVFDMSWDRYKPICVQGLISKRRGRLNHVAFNPSHPIIIGKYVAMLLLV